MLTAVGMTTNDDARHAILALDANEMISKAAVREQRDARAMGHKIVPVGALRIGERRGDELEIFGAVGIRANDELVANVVGVILHARFTPGDEPEACIGRANVQQPFLAGLRAAQREDDESARCAARHGG